MLDPLGPDLGSLAFFTGLRSQEAVLAQLAKKHRGLRFSHGYVFQHLREQPRHVGDLAKLMGVSSQLASRTVLELEKLGYVKIVVDPNDARRTVAQLSKKGHAAIDAATALRAAQDALIAKAVGKKDLEIAKRVLARARDALGSNGRARRGRGPLIGPRAS